jgi:YHS domain-containing protein
MKSLMFTVVVALLVGVTTAAWAGCCGAAKPMADQAAVVPSSHAQATCPVMGEKLDKSVYSDYEGRRVYFCCGACKSAFAKDPGKYIKQMESEGVQLEKVPAQE